MFNNLFKDIVVSTKRFDIYKIKQNEAGYYVCQWSPVYKWGDILFPFRGDWVACDWWGYHETKYYDTYAEAHQRAKQLAS
jgi:hypothetical protein